MYAKISAEPAARLTGKIVARIMKYVGLQVENTGPSAAPTTISPHVLCFINPLDMSLFESWFAFARPGIKSQSFGKRKSNPTIRRMPPESQSQNICGTEINAVETLMRNVNIKTETPSERVTIAARLKLLPPASEPPTITGKSGNTHGESTVSTPATNEMRKSVMRLL
jgi:hypothetical protein